MYIIHTYVYVSDASKPEARNQFPRLVVNRRGDTSSPPNCPQFSASSKIKPEAHGGTHETLEVGDAYSGPDLRGCLRFKVSLVMFPNPCFWK